jgi:integrase
MRGHTYRRGRTWTYVIDVGVGPNGKRKQRSKGGFETKRKAQAALNEAINSLQKGVYIEPNKLLVGQFLLEQWLPAARSTIRPSTFASYQMHVRRHLVPALGHVPLPRLNAPTINAFYSELQQPTDGRRPLSPASVRRVHATLHRSLRDAVRWQLVPQNVAATADPPRASRPQTTVWTAQQLRFFLDGVEDDPLYPLWLFYAMTGTRRGEALALRWTDLDLDCGRAVIRRTLVPVEHRLSFAEPKTDKGRRSISLDPATVAVLCSHRLRQADERLLMGTAYHDEDLVFSRPDGRLIHPEYVSRRFSRLVAGSELPPIRLHDLRHTHATMALVAGVATLVVSERLGHSAMSVTSDIYQQVLPSLEEEAAAKVAALVFESALPK